MDDAVALEPSARSARRAPSLGRQAAAAVVYAVVAANAAVIVWLWVHGGNLALRHRRRGAARASGRITGLLCAPTSRCCRSSCSPGSPRSSGPSGFDRLTVWHRWNGHACIDLVVAHVVFTVWGYALMDKITVGERDLDDARGRRLPRHDHGDDRHGDAARRSWRPRSSIVRRRLSYEWWYAVHLLAYAGIALSWFHEIPTGNELVLDPMAADYWRGLYLATIAILVVFRVGVPLAQLAPLPAAGRRRRRRRGPASSRCTSSVASSTAWAPSRASSSSGGSSTAAASGRRTRSRSRPRPTASSLRITVKAPRRPQRPHRRRATGHARARRGAVRRLHGVRQAAPREGAADRRRHRDHADPLARRADAR